MNAQEPVPFKSADWPEPDLRWLRPERLPPPAPPLEAVLSPRWAAWIREAAEAKGAPPDYVMVGTLAACGALIGNSRWAAPWEGWAEPPIIWAMLIGQPSANKSPALDAVLAPLKALERELRAEMAEPLSQWTAKAELAKLADSTWKETFKTALKEGKETPKKPAAADPGPEPFAPRLFVADATVEKLAVILQRQPRGLLQARDELAGWLQNMSRYSNGGSDRPFWLEAYGGRGYSVERMGREAVSVERLALGVLGGIQPDRLRTLLFKSDDDGLLARFLPIWPDPAPVARPRPMQASGFLERALRRLWSLEMLAEPDGSLRPFLLPFAEGAREVMDSVRSTVREAEKETEGLMLSFLGKAPGLLARLALVLALMDWASGEAEEPRLIEATHAERALDLVWLYLRPMAQRSYGEASASTAERAGRRLLALIRKEGLRGFSTREVMRMNRSGLGDAKSLEPALAALVEGDALRLIPEEASSKGRPTRRYAVNPTIFAKTP